eukprot:CAMPEP_0174283046 /NCGR_PEP_ID=MMETSP0809-20121228/3632_1 /TAXON_ID=73025 ORGANISM="Eutreptiella gymnastica-like, Strain CCMP1594" /NCGR_SAMPLE_ID=MMETSP0809 /ASSEMBLY_ACC=CAM_ASM_000658 /LENGTH=942 /DNA_ID=CAMNT_0015377659 /DNA_START=62 /DNA_END=2890 /DNA_ORIENTATION=-
MTQTYVGMSLLEDRVYSGISFETHDSEQRLWMEENVLGTLVPALQELIQAVRMKQEEEQDPHAILTPPLNPIDWLASLLMRNNPKHNINATKHPYYQLLQDHVRRVRALNNAATQGERDRAEAQRLEEARRQEEEAQRLAEEQRREEERRLKAEQDALEAERAERERAEREAAEEAARQASAQQETPAEDEPEEPVPEGITDEEKDQLWMEMLDARHKKQRDAMPTFLTSLRTKTEAVTSPEELRTLYDHVVQALADLMDGVAAYIAHYDSNTGQLAYEHASSNCSPLLRSKTVALNREAHPNAPVFQALEDNSSLHIPGLAASQEVVHCGDYPNPGDGDMFVGSVIDVFGNPLAALIVDTLTSNTRTPSVREQQLYGEEGPPREYRPIEEDEQEFLQQVVAELSGASVNAAASGTFQQVQELAAQAFNKDIRGICQNAVDLLGPLLGPTSNVYISLLETADNTDCFRVIAQFAAPEDRGHSQMIGKTLSSAKDPSGLACALLQGSGDDNFFFVANTLEEPSVGVYTDGDAAPDKPEGSLCVVGIQDVAGKTVGVLGVEDVVDGIYDAQLAVINKMADTLSGVLQTVFARKTMTAMCQQATEWLGIQTGVENIYLSLATSEGPLRYVAASPSQEFLLGQQLEAGTGMGYEVMQQSTHLCTAIADEPRIHLWDEAHRGQPGNVLMLPIALEGQKAFGILAADTLGDKKKDFTQQDIECFAQAAQILAIIFGEIGDGVVNDNSDEVTLDIENVLGARAIRFLKKVWLNLRSDVEHLTKDQILEMANYKAPTQTIHDSVRAALIILGSKPSKVSEWKDCRPKLKMTLIEKILKLDPTKKGKSIKYQTARKMLKGLTVDTVLDKGSLPASILYQWCFVSIQLRRAAVALRKKAGPQVASPLLDDDELAMTMGGETDPGADDDGSPDDGEDGAPDSEDEGGDDSPEE